MPALMKAWPKPGLFICTMMSFTRLMWYLPIVKVVKAVGNEVSVHSGGVMIQKECSVHPPQCNPAALSQPHQHVKHPVCPGLGPLAGVKGLQQGGNKRDEFASTSFGCTLFRKMVEGDQRGLPAVPWSRPRDRPCSPILPPQRIAHTLSLSSSCLKMLLMRSSSANASDS
jgi:hypothetical protein